jgi:hypothetical protein
MLEIEDYNVINIGYYNYRPRNNQVRNWLNKLLKLA